MLNLITKFLRTIVRKIKKIRFYSTEMSTLPSYIKKSKVYRRILEESSEELLKFLNVKDIKFLIISKI
jgi:hypothetical protein